MKIVALITFITLVLSMCLSSCGNSKDVATVLPERSFILGSGGGFTGAYLTYRIHSTGKVELQDKGQESFSFLKTLPLDSARASMIALDNLDLANYNFNHPGNMTFYIELRQGDAVKSVKWGASGHPVREDINAFFNRMRTMIAAEYQ